MEENVIIGRVIVPADKDRDEYVTYCLQQHVVSVLTDNGYYHRECPVAFGYMGVNDGFIYSLDFPADTDTLGSTVLMVNLAQFNQPIIIGCLPNRTGRFMLNEEEQIIIQRTRETEDTLSTVKIDLKGLTGIIDLVSYSDTTEGGKVRLSAKNADGKGELEIRADVYNRFLSGDETVEIEGSVKRIIGGSLQETVEEAYNMTISDPSTWEFEDDITIHSQSTAKLDADTEVQLGSSNLQPVLLGDDTVDRLDDIVGLISDLAQALLSFTSTNAIPAAPVSSSPATITSATQILTEAQALAGQLALLKSQKVKTE